MLAEMCAPFGSRTLSDKALRSEWPTGDQEAVGELRYSGTKRSSEVVPAAMGGDGASWRVRSSVFAPPMVFKAVHDTIIFLFPGALFLVCPMGTVHCSWTGALLLARCECVVSTSSVAQPGRNS